MDMYYGDGRAEDCIIAPAHMVLIKLVCLLKKVQKLLYTDNELWSMHKQTVLEWNSINTVHTEGNLSPFSAQTSQ